jgi:hypothetical protein
MAEPLFDDMAREQRRWRALAREPRPFLAERIVQDLRERLLPVRRRFERALVTGCPPALHGDLADCADTVLFASTFDAIATHGEGAFDLLLVIGELDARDDLPLLLQVARSRMRAGGLAAGALPGGNSLPALRQSFHAAGAVSGSFVPRTHPRIEPGALANLLASAGFAEPVVDIDRVQLRYRSLQRLVGDLRDHGATNVLRSRARRGLDRTELAAAADAFAALGSEGVTTEQVELLFFAAWTGPANIRA